MTIYIAHLGTEEHEFSTIEEVREYIEVQPNANDWRTAMVII